MTGEVEILVNGQSTTKRCDLARRPVSLSFAP